MEQLKIGKFIATIRKEKKMTQDDLAERLGVSSKSVSRWETGKCMPDISLLEPLSIELGITINEVIKGSRILDDDIKKETDNNLKNSLLEIKKAKKIIKKLFIVMSILMILIALFQILVIPKIGFSSFEIMHYSEEFYELLKTGDYKKIENAITEKYTENQWHTSVTNYTTDDFIDGLKYMKQNSIEYDKFIVNKFSNDGSNYYVTYKMCFKQDLQKACVSMEVFKAEEEKNKYLFVVMPIGEKTDLQDTIIDIFNPVWYID